MNDTVTLLQAQTENLLRRVARERESRLLAIRSAAEEQAHAIVVRARQEARARLQQAVAEERRQFERAVGDKRAALDTVARRAEQAAFRALLEQAWQRLPGAVAGLWDEDTTRDEWIAAACACAVRSLHAGASCSVEVAPQDADANGAAAVAQLRAAGLDCAGYRAVDGLGAGLRVRADGAVVDATVSGLLASRERVEAELLAEFDHLAAAARPGSDA